MRDEMVWRKVVDELDADASRSDRAIASVVGCSAPFVGKVRRRYVHDHDALMVDLEEPEAELLRFLDGVADKQLSPQVEQILRERRTSGG